MSSVKPQPISGVSASVENVVMTVYPSIAATGLGRGLGTLFNSIPIRINGVMLSHLLFPLPLSPIAALLYFQQKLFGSRYVLTNRSLQIWNSLGNQIRSQVALADISEVEIVQSSGQLFYKAADLILLGANGGLLLRLDGVPRADVFRETILKARDARTQNDASLATINSRQTA